jgi:hypothetical protein
MRPEEGAAVMVNHHLGVKHHFLLELIPYQKREFRIFSRPEARPKPPQGLKGGTPHEHVHRLQFPVLPWSQYRGVATGQEAPAGSGSQDEAATLLSQRIFVRGEIGATYSCHTRILEVQRTTAEPARRRIGIGIKKDADVTPSGSDASIPFQRRVSA